MGAWWSVKLLKLQWVACGTFADAGSLERNEAFTITNQQVRQMQKSAEEEYVFSTISSVLDFDLCTLRDPSNIETLQGSRSSLIMCYKGELPNIKTRYKGFMC